MDKKSLKLIQIIIVAIIALIAVVYFVLIIRDTENASGAIDGMLRFTYIVLGITLLATVLVWIADIVKHPKKLVKSGIAAGLFLVVVLFAKFVLASKEPAHFYKNIDADAATSNWIDTGLYTFYILGGFALLLMFLSPLLSMFAPNATANAVGEIEEEIEELVDEDE